MFGPVVLARLACGTLQRACIHLLTRLQRMDDEAFSRSPAVPACMLETGKQFITIDPHGLGQGDVSLRNVEVRFDELLDGRRRLGVVVAVRGHDVTWLHFSGC